MNAGTQVTEDFWGIALAKNNTEVEWAVEDDDEDSIFSEKTLELRQACLGSSAKEGERNVVELVAENDEGDRVTHTLLSMRVGGIEQCPLFLTLQPPVKFKLVQGSGPLHLVGQINETIDLNMLNEDDEDDEDEEEEEEETLREIMKAKGIKRPNPSSVPKLPSAKVPKVEADDAMNTSNGGKWDDDEDSEDDEDEEDDESDEDEEDEESEEEEMTKPVLKKSKGNDKKNGTPHTKGKPGAFKTPQAPPSKSASIKQSKSQSLPNTPKNASGKKKNQGKGGAGDHDINEIKQRLTKMSVPKKLEKFNNFVSNSFKIKDDSIKKQLWEYVQKNKPQM